MNCAFTDQQENLQQSPVSSSSSSSSSSGAADRQQTFSQNERVNKYMDMMSDTLALADEEKAKQGIHELEISFGGELDLHKHFNRCTKNPGHFQFIPINDLTKEYLPLNFQTDTKFKWIKLRAYLTVKLSVNYISTSRPPELPLSSRAGQRILSVGSGCVTHLCRTDNKDTMTCPFEDCHDLPGQHQVYGYITIATAAHVVFDDDEAKNTTVEFFYDSSEDKSGVLTARGIKVGAVSVEGDFCELLCVTHDRDLFDLIQHLLSGCEVCPVLYDFLNNKRELISALFHRVTSLDRISLSGSLSDGGVLQIKMGKCEISDIKNVLSELQTLNMLLALCDLAECFCYLEKTEVLYVERSGSGFIIKCGNHKIKWRSTQLMSCPYKDSLLRDILYSRSEHIWKFLLDKVQILSDDPVSQASWNEFFIDSLHQLRSLWKFLIRNNIQLEKANNLFEGYAQLNAILNRPAGEKKLQSNISVFLTIVEEFFNRINDLAVQETVFDYLLYKLGQLISSAACELKDFHELNTINDILNIVEDFTVRCRDKLQLNVISELMDRMQVYKSAVSSWKYQEYDYVEFLHLMSEFLNKMSVFFSDDQITHQNVFKIFLVSIGELVSMVASKLLNQNNIKLIQQVHFCLEETLKFVNRFDDYLVKQSIISGFLNKIDEFLNYEPYVSKLESDEEVLNRTGEILTLVKQIKCEFDVHSEHKNSLSKFIFRMGECISHTLRKIAQGKEFHDFLDTLCAYAYTIDELMKRFDDANFMSGFVNEINECMNSMSVVRVNDYVALPQTVNEVFDIMSNIMKRIDYWSVRHIVFSTFLYDVQYIITKSFVLQKQDADLIILHKMTQTRHFNRVSHSMSRSEDEQVQENIRSEDEQVQENIRSEDEHVQENIRSEDEHVQENIRSEDEQVQENIISENQQVQENIRSEGQKVQENIRSEDEQVQEIIRSEDKKVQENIRFQDKQVEGKIRSEDEQVQEIIKSEDQKVQENIRSEDKEVQENIRSEDQQVQEIIRSEDEQVQENMNKVHMENLKRKFSSVLAELNVLSNQIASVSRVLDVVDKYLNDLHDQQTEQHIFRRFVTDMNKVFEISDFEWEKERTFILNRMQNNLSKGSEILYEIVLLLKANEVEHLQQNHDDCMRKIKEQQKQLEDFHEHLRSTELKLQSHCETCLNKYLSQVKQPDTASRITKPQNYFTELTKYLAYQQTFLFRYYNVQRGRRKSKAGNYFTLQKGITEHFMNIDNTVGWLVHISHPHGQSKHVTFGKQTDCLTGHGHYKQLYTAPTCSGSSGGPVWMIPATGDLSQVYGVPHSGHHGNQLNCGCSLTLYPQNRQT